MTDDPLWHLEQVRLTGERGRLRVGDLSVMIHKGITAIVGESGAGKTSLLNLLVGFEKPHQGRLDFQGQQSNRLPMYWVPQDDGLWPHLTAIEHLRAVCHLSEKMKKPGKALSRTKESEPIPPEGSIRSPKQWLEAMDLADHANHKPASLSRGQCNRLSVARAMASGARILVMDEPFSHVDAEAAERYWQVLLNHVARKNGSLVLATHDAERVLACADHVLCLEDGVILASGEVQSLYWCPPNVKAARLLGPVNWFESKDAQKWFETAPPSHPCVRPVKLQLHTQSQSPCVVVSSTFRGNLVQTRLHHERFNIDRTVWHLPDAPDNLTCRPNQRIILKWLGCLCLLLSGCLLMMGCDQTPTGMSPALNVRSESVWHVPAQGATLPAPRSATITPAGQMIVLDTAGRILFYDRQGKVVKTWHMPTNANGNPEDALLLHDGRVAVADTHYHRVVFFDPTGKVVNMLGTRGKGPGQFIYPVSLAQDNQDNLYVCEYGGHDRIQKFTPQGKFILEFGQAGTSPGSFQRAGGMIWHQGKLYIVDAINNRIQVFTDTGKWVAILGANQLNLPYDVCLGKNKSLYVIEYGAGCVTQMSLTGKILGRYGSPGMGTGQFVTPWSVVMDMETHRVRVMDTGNHRIVELAF